MPTEQQSGPTYQWNPPRRNHNDNRFGLSTIGLVVVIATNLFALVWGAATMQNSITSLQVTVAKMEAAVAQLTTVFSQISERQAVL